MHKQFIIVIKKYIKTINYFIIGNSSTIFINYLTTQYILSRLHKGNYTLIIKNQNLINGRYRFWQSMLSSSSSKGNNGTKMATYNPPTICHLKQQFVFPQRFYFHPTINWRDPKHFHSIPVVRLWFEMNFIQYQYLDELW